MKPNAKVKAILSRIEYATLATADNDGNPWSAPVYVAYDEQYTFYWGSHSGSQHSKNILATRKVFLSLYNSTALPGTGEGVYIQATADELTSTEDIAFAHILIQDRRNPIPYWRLEQFQANESPIRLYKAIPEHIWTNGDTTINGTYVDIRIDAASNLFPRKK